MSSNTVSVSSSIDVVSLSAIENAVSVVFGDRPKALEDGSQGDHTIAYALYQKWLVKSIEESIARSNNDCSDPAWIGLFVKKMQKKLMEEGALLKKFELSFEPSAQTTAMNSFKDFLTEAVSLEDTYIDDVDIKRYTAHQGRVNSDTEVPEEFIEIYGADNLEKYRQQESESFEILIKQRKIALGAKVAEKAAIAFLEIKNASPKVSFKQVPGRAVDKGQGGRINGALNALSNYISGELSSIAPDKQEEEVVQIQPGTRPEGKRKINQPQRLGNFVTGNDPRYNQDAGKNQDIANKLAGHIIKLLDFKKLRDEEINAVKDMYKDEKVKKKLPESRLRTNEKKVLLFTIASLLATTFQTFPETGKNEDIKKRTVEAVISKLLSQEYAGKDSKGVNNAAWDSNDISSDDVNEILGLLGISNSKTNAPTPKKPLTTASYLTPLSLLKAQQKFRGVINLRKKRVALGGPGTPRRPSVTTEKSLQREDKKSRLSLEESSLPASAKKFIDEIKSSKQTNPPKPLMFSLSLNPGDSSVPPKSPPQPQKRVGPRFGGGKT